MCVFHFKQITFFENADAVVLLRDKEKVADACTNCFVNVATLMPKPIAPGADEGG